MTGPIRSSTGERSHDAFVESPTRANKTAVEVFIGGSAINGNTETQNAGEILSALKCVYSNSPNTVSLANNNIAFLNANVFGLTITAAQANESTQVQTYGILRDSSFNWIAGAQLYLGTNGNLTDTAPLSGFRTLVATSQGAGSIFINIQEPIIL
jgi:hypothetical protein